MKFKTGDKVKFLNDIGGGSITRTEGEELVYVMIEDGFEVPVKPADIIRDVGDEWNENTQGPETEAEEIEETVSDELALSDIDLTNPENVNVNILLGLVPDRIANIAISNLEVYLINDSNYGMMFHLGFLEGNTVTKIKTDVLEDNTKVFCGKFDQSKLTKVKKIIVQAIPFGNNRYRLQEPINHVFDVQQIDFYRTKSYKTNDYFEDKAILLDTGNFDLADEIKKLENSDFSVILKDKGDELMQGKKKEAKKAKTPAIEEVDLHIHAIQDDYENLSNGKMLEFQLDRFETALEGALRNNTLKIVFIHGVGNGKLKYELRKKLDRKYPDLRYQDASFREYGYGATLVYLK